MTRKRFLEQLVVSGMGIPLLQSCVMEGNTSGELMMEPISFPVHDQVTLHALPCGRVKVKNAHKNNSLGIPQILLDPFWTDWLPIWVWLIEHPEGNILIDTGEQPAALTKKHYACDPATGWVNQKILKFQIEENWEVHRQLAKVGKSPEDIRWVVLTHMHLDHVDGLRHFSKSEIIVSQVEAVNPSGSIPCLLPSWFAPRRITYEKSLIPHFSHAKALTKAKDVVLLSTPGHTYGHQSVLIRRGEYDICLAGDVSFTQQQLLEDKVAGINADKTVSRKTYSEFLQYAKERPLVYLPTHDPFSLQRLKNQVFLL
ncbi:MAG: N-acyl homoserine lactonase family protein [Bacteroidota bacterium]